MATITGTNRIILLPNLYYTERLIGTTSNDILSGLRGDDLMDGGNGDDSLYGGQLNSSYLDGRDTIVGGAGNDYVDGGNEDEINPYLDLNGDPTTTNTGILNPNFGGDSLDGGIGNDKIFGRAGHDYLNGGKGISSGNDYLDGGTGDDTVVGDHGSDILVGGEGDDLLAGGVGGVAGDSSLDWFVWTNPNEIGDRVQDFTKGLDKVVLNASTFGLNITGTAITSKPLSYSLATQSGLFANTTPFHRLDSSEYEKIIVGSGGFPDLSSALASATDDIVGIIPNGITSDVQPASLYYNNGGNYELIATFTNGVTPTQTSTTLFDILVY
ncbi:calcium-binding protein [Geminocystis sp. NIES-3709]|uniref:calcium-binding protein n=1 Tax=Geminocystis sp. NIES-3709 TaxID=1617448 RepID=UPI0005FC5572|nr:calcium-binding protein [Geminocystis sp. NIES-3709]BAQ65986.1 alkaline phosphatase [Geminocystis sp. NIES-3709]